MSHENKRDLTIIGCILIAIALFFALRYVYLSYSIDNQVPECEDLVPLDSPLALPNYRPEEAYKEKEIDFSEKKRIGWRKYGFRRKIEVKEKTIIAQGIVEDLALENVYYGIYKDAKLKRPIAEVSLKDMLEASTDIEMGASIEDYPDYVPYYEIVLEPGAYYLATYSTDPADKSLALYESRKAVVDTDLSLNEGKWGFFFSTGKDQKTYFQIKVTKPGVLSVERDFWKVTYDVWLCNAKKEPISQAVLNPLHPKKVRQKAQVNVSEAGTYYLQVSPSNKEPSSWACEIRYTQE